MTEPGTIDKTGFVLPIPAVSKEDTAVFFSRRYSAAYYKQPLTLSRISGCIKNNNGP